MTWGQIKTFMWGSAVVILDFLLGWIIDALSTKQSRRGR